MNKPLGEGVALASQIASKVGSVWGVDVVLCPPFISLSGVAESVKGTSIKIGAQNMHYESSGAFTGEVSAPMLIGICQYVIVGHSERRQHFGETDETVNHKVQAAFRAGLQPIMCVGETLRQREEGKTGEVITRQVQGGLEGVHNVAGLVIAYEPVWAIGTGVAATPEVAAEVMGGMILEVLNGLYGNDAAHSVPLLYGGSVNPGNVEGFARQDCIHGGLVGGASLDAEQFADIVQSTARAKGAR